MFSIKFCANLFNFLTIPAERQTKQGGKVGGKELNPCSGLLMEIIIRPQQKKGTEVS